MTDNAKIALVLIIMTATIIGGCSWKIYQWRECKAQGLSNSYCIQHVL